MATKVLQSEIWAARDNDDNKLFLYANKPIYNEKNKFYQDIKHDKGNDSIQNFIKTIFCRRHVPREIEQMLNLTTIDKPYKIALEITFTDLPDSSDSSSDSSEESSPTLEIKRAKEAVHTCCNCVLLTKKDYREILKKLEDLKKVENAYSNLKGAYFDLKGSLKAILNQFDE